MYVEGEAWQEPLQENRDYIIKKCTLYVYNNMTIKQGSECQQRGRRPTGEPLFRFNVLPSMQTKEHKTG